MEGVPWVAATEDEWVATQWSAGRQVPCEGGHLEHGLAGAADWCYGVWAGEKMVGVRTICNS